MLTIVGKTYSIPHELLERVAESTSSFIGRDDTEIELKFVSIAEISRLNRVYRNKKGPTDVLSFGLTEKPLLGQVFICYTFARKQAQNANKSLDDEIALLLVHGILHIAGFDHGDDLQTIKMQDMETKILERIGISR